MAFAAWKGCLDDLVARGLRAPMLVIMDGNARLRRVVGEIWPRAALQRCCVHKLRNLERKAPKHVLARSATISIASSTRPMPTPPGAPALPSSARGPSVAPPVPPAGEDTGALPSEDAAIVLLFSLVASGQIKLRRIDGWRKIAAVFNQHPPVAA